jgi:hypothetical protein
MARKKVEGQPSKRSLLARSPEIQDVGRQLAVLALAQAAQDGVLGVRQGEQLRRALATAGDILRWTSTAASSSNVIVDVSKDVLTMCKAGSKSIASDLAEELVRKTGEMDQLTEKGTVTRALAEDPDTAYPFEVVYCYTVRDAYSGLVTKTETITVNDAKENNSAADGIERNLTGRGKLRDLMIIDLGQKQERLEEMTRTLPDFVKSTHELLEQVMSTLQ